jgi:tetratricopeptide (TPR) repeat protein
MNVLRYAVVLLLAASIATTVSVAASPAVNDAASKLPVTTSSPEAARHFETAAVHYENHRWNLALNEWNEAIKLDPKFAQAYVWICFTTADPAEEARDRAIAKALMNDVTPGEQLLIRWMAGVHENRYVEGIMAMNDMLAMFPHDKRLNFMTGYWLFRFQDEYEVSKKVTLRALADDPNYATCYNQMAYIYSRLGDFEKALEYVAKYVEMLPHQPNPHDSYGEMLRFAGRYSEAIEQYHTALKIDPTFYISQKELGETYSLMGEEQQARKEYEKAIAQAPSNGVKAEYLQKRALTYVREKKYADADAAYQDAADKARATEQWIWEARAYRVMAMYEPDHLVAVRNLDHAEVLLRTASGKVDPLDLDEEKAQVLRTRVETAVNSGDLNQAQKALTKLEDMSSSSSVHTQRIYQGAAGTLLVAEKKYADAIPHLEEDVANPLSMKLLITAYRETGNAEEANNLSKKLETWKVPSTEEALAAFDSSHQVGMAPAPLRH